MGHVHHVDKTSPYQTCSIDGRNPCAAAADSWGHDLQQVPLQQIVDELNQTFASDIRIADEALKDYRITATFEGEETLDTILDLLQRVASLQIEHQGQTIIIKKGGAADEG